MKRISVFSRIIITEEKYNFHQQNLRAEMDKSLLINIIKTTLSKRERNVFSNEPIILRKRMSAKKKGTRRNAKNVPNFVLGKCDGVCKSLLLH